MSKARKLINEIKLKDVKKGSDVTVKKDNFRLKGQIVKIVSIDDPGTGEDDVLIKVKANDGKTIELGLEELQ